MTDGRTDPNYRKASLLKMWTTSEKIVNLIKLFKLSMQFLGCVITSANLHIRKVFHASQKNVKVHKLEGKMDRTVVILAVLVI